jgi:hypothetical protein
MDAQGLPFEWFHDFERCGWGSETSSASSQRLANSWTSAVHRRAGAQSDRRPRYVDPSSHTANADVKAIMETATACQVQV